VDKRGDNLKRLLAPRSIAAIGGRVARNAAQASLEAGFSGDVFVINPRLESMEGAVVLPHIADLPIAPDAAFIGLSPAQSVAAVSALSAMGAGGAIAYADGFDDPAPIRRAAGDLALVGPNCYGLINCLNGGSLWPTKHPLQCRDKGIAILAQSGNLCINLSISQRSIPFSYIISVGNQWVLSMADFIAQMADDPAVSAIGLFMEGLPDIDAFVAAAGKALDNGKPIVACKVGQSPLGAELAMSHTATLAGSSALYEALFERLGIVQVETIPAMTECLKLATMWRSTPNRRLAVVSTSGGDCELAADHAAAAGLDLSAPTDKQTARLREILPAAASVSNPLDYSNLLWGDETALTPVFTEMLRQNYDAALLIIEHPPTIDGSPAFADAVAATQRALLAARDAFDIDAAVACVLPESMPEEIQQRLIADGVAPLLGLDTALAAIGALSRRDTALAALASEPSLAILGLGPGHEDETRTYNEWDAKEILAGFAIMIPARRLVHDKEPDIAGLAYPVAVKAVHDDLPHKTEAGAVVLGATDKAAVTAAMASIKNNVARHDDEITIENFLVEEIVDGAVLEMIAGIHRDPVFGLTMTIGAGGILVELLDDTASLLLPTTSMQIRRALQKLRCHPLLTGHRNGTRGDVEALVNALLALSAFAEAWSERLDELDINPLFVLAEGQGVIAGDALIRARS